MTNRKKKKVFFASRDSQTVTYIVTYTFSGVSFVSASEWDEVLVMLSITKKAPEKRPEGLAKLHSHFMMKSISQQGFISKQGLVAHSHFEPYLTVLALCSGYSIQVSHENHRLIPK